MDQPVKTKQPWDDPGLGVYWPILQRTPSDCGVACLAMAANVTYTSALYVFDELGLARKRKGRAVYSSNFRNLQDALRILHCTSQLKRFTSWNAVQGPGIFKVDNGSRYNWHWVYATRDEVHGLIVLDPLGSRFLEHQGMDSMPLSYWTPKGSWICLNKNP